MTMERYSVLNLKLWFGFVPISQIFTYISGNYTFIKLKPTYKTHILVLKN